MLLSTINHIPQTQVYLSYTFNPQKESYPMKLDISEYYYEGERIINIPYRKLVSLLEQDGVEFNSEIIKYFDPKLKGWVKQHFQRPLEINLANQQIESFDFWILLKENDQKSVKKKAEDKIQKKFDEKIMNLVQQITAPLEQQVQALLSIKQEISKVKVNGMQQGSQNFDDNNVNIQMNSSNNLATLKLTVPDTIAPSSPRPCLDRMGDSNHPPPRLNQQSSTMLLAPQLRSNQSQNYTNNLMPSSIFGEDGIDIGIMYSDPLDPDHVSGDPVNFEKEIKKLKSNLQNTQKSLTMKIDIATYKKMHQMALQQPKILHFICHGSYSQQLKEYFLHFETDDARLFKCTRDHIQDIKKEMQNIKLVFVNACHSQEVAKVFHDAGIPYVVAVQSNLKIEEEIAQEFSVNFYTSIFAGREVPDAFETARNMSKNIRGDKCYTCCCAHEHKPDCKWKIIMKGDCSKHIPTCDCPKKLQLIHRFDPESGGCQWAKDFIEELGLYTEDEMDDIMFEDEEISVCCCPPSDKSKSIKHDESMKFQLMVNDDSGLEAIIFDNQPTGDIEDISKWRQDTHYVWKQLFVNKKQLRQIYDYLKSPVAFFIEVYGPTGIGKSSAVEYIGNYVSERGMFQHGVFTINFAAYNLITTRNVKEYIKDKFECSSYEYLYNYLAHHDLLLIFDNCSQVIKQDEEEFKDFMNELMEKTHGQVKVILTTQKGQGKNLNLKDYYSLELKQLDEIKSMELFLYHLPNDRIRNICNTPKYQKKVQQLVRLMKRYPRNIISASKHIQDTGELEEYIKKMENDPFHKIEELYTDNIEGFKLLIIISFFPNGLTLDDLDIMEELEIIKGCWKEHFFKLIKKPILKKPVKEEDIECGYFFYVDVKKVQIKKDLEVKVFKTDFFSGMDEEEFKFANLSDIFDDVLKYNAYYCKTIIKLNPRLQFESTDLSYSILWNFKYSNRNKEMLDIMQASTVMENSQDELAQKKVQEFSHKFKRVMKKYNKKPLQIYEHIHQKNFYTNLIQDDFNQFVESLTKNQIKSKIYIEALCQYLPHIFYILCPNQIDVVCQQSLQILEKIFIAFDINSNDSTLLQIARIQFMLLNIYFSQAFPENNQQQRDSQAYQNFSDQLKCVEKFVQQPLMNKDVYKTVKIICEIELLFVKAQTIQANFKYKPPRYDLTTAMPGEDVNNQYAQDLLKQGIKILDKQINSNLLTVESDKNKQVENMIIIRYKYYILLSKLILTQQFGANKWQNCNLVLQELFSAVKHFEQKRLIYLDIEARLQISDIAIKGQGKLESVKTIDQLVQVRSNYLNQCQKLSERIKNPHLLAEYAKLKNKMNEVINKNKANLFNFQRCIPLVACEFGKMHDLTETLTRQTQFFREKMLELLDDTKKEIFVKFEVCTQENFYTAIEKGTTLLNLDFIYEEDNHMVFENPHYPMADALPLKEFENRYIENPEKLGYVQILMIGAKQGRQYAQSYKRMVEEVNKKRMSDNQIKQPHIITFEFKQNLFNVMQRSIHTKFNVNSPIEFIQKMSIQYFYIKFTEQLVYEHCIKDAFEKARDSMIQKITELYQDQISCATQYEDIIGTGPILFEVGEEFHKFGKINLKQGSVTNISGNHAPTNIKKKYLGQSFTARNKDLVTIMQKVNKGETINVYGNVGIGKTDFVLQLGYIMASRYQFSDGVYYFSLKELFEIEDYHMDLKELMAESLGDQFSQKILSFFTDKMCFIFDDFDEYYNQQDNIKNFTYIIDSVIKSNCGLIFITQKPYDYLKSQHLSMQERNQIDFHNKLKKQQLLESFFQKAKKPVEKYPFQMLSISECHLLLEGIVNNNFYYFEQKDKEQIKPKLSEFMMVQKNKGNLKSMIDYFLKIMEEVVGKEICINPNPAYILFGYDSNMQQTDSLMEPQLTTKYSNNLFINRKYSHINSMIDNTPNSFHSNNQSFNQILSNTSPKVSLYEAKIEIISKQPQNIKDQVRLCLEKKQTDKFKELFLKNKIKVLEDISENGTKWTGLHYACSFNDEQALEFLLDLGDRQYGSKNTQKFLECRSQEGLTCQMVCAIRNGYSCLDTLILKNKNGLQLKDAQNNTVQDLIFQHNFKECVQVYRKYFPVERVIVTENSQDQQNSQEKKTQVQQLFQKIFFEKYINGSQSQDNKQIQEEQSQFEVSKASEMENNNNFLRVDNSGIQNRQKRSSSNNLDRRISQLNPQIQDTLDQLAQLKNSDDNNSEDQKKISSSSLLDQIGASLQQQQQQESNVDLNTEEQLYSNLDIKNKSDHILQPQQDDPLDMLGLGKQVEEKQLTISQFKREQQMLNISEVKQKILEDMQKNPLEQLGLQEVEQKDPFLELGVGAQIEEKQIEIQQQDLFDQLGLGKEVEEQIVEQIDIIQLEKQQSKDKQQFSSGPLDMQELSNRGDTNSNGQYDRNIIVGQIQQQEDQLNQLDSILNQQQKGQNDEYQQDQQQDEFELDIDNLNHPLNNILKKQQSSEEILTLEDIMRNMSETNYNNQSSGNNIQQQQGNNNNGNMNNNYRNLKPNMKMIDELDIEASQGSGEVSREVMEQLTGEMEFKRGTSVISNINSNDNNTDKQIQEQQLLPIEIQQLQQQEENQAQEQKMQD